MKSKNKKSTVGFVALGCPKNLVDSERMLAEIANADLIITNDVDNADVIVINTCGFIAPAKNEAFENIGHAIERKNKGKVKKVIVAGCLPQREKKSLFKQMPGIDAIVGLGQRDNIAKIIKKTLEQDKAIGYFSKKLAPIDDDKTRLRITPPHWAYLRISEGCSHKCSFCTIPSIRGPFRSKPFDSIISEANELVDSGATELNLIAQDSSFYGKDQKMKNGLVSLVKEIEKIDKLRWLRIMYLYPVGITDKLIETIAESSKLLHYLDVPLQHASTTVLKQMRRPDTNEKLRILVEKIRKNIPDVVLRTTFIVGFPGETDRDFDELLDFVKWARFDCLGCFKYYREKGTPSAEMTNQIPEEIKHQRLETIMFAQQKIAFEQSKARIGTKLTCLIDSKIDGKNAIGRFYGQAPDIDSVCIISGCKGKPGDFVNTKVVSSKDYDLAVKQI